MQRSKGPEAFAVLHGFTYDLLNNLFFIFVFLLSICEYSQDMCCFTAGNLQMGWCQEMGLTADSMDDFLDQGAAETQDSETLPQRIESKFN